MLLRRGDNEQGHVPTINKVSKDLIREGKSWERLYHEAEEKKKREEREKVSRAERLFGLRQE